jgi:3-oxoacyl-[acyl-carrier-protein] synthase-3
MTDQRAVITGTGSYIPSEIQRNSDFHTHTFYSQQGEVIDSPAELITKKFGLITGIEERRYASQHLQASDIGFFAAEKAIADAGIEKEKIDQIIVAHNFGDVRKHTIQSDNMPALAARIKHLLKISNPYCVAYDILFGCPGWVQGVIQSDAFLKSGQSKSTLVIGAETLSRVLDINDRDSMIFADGAGACILELMQTERDAGVLSTAAMTHAEEELDYLFLGKSNFPASDPRVRFIKMNGRKVYEYALTHVPLAMKECLDRAGISVLAIKKIFIHQANEKLDQGIIDRLYKLYNAPVPDFIMPMSIHKLGNSSVATVPTLYDLVKHGELSDHVVNEGDLILFASVGAGMNINAFCYRV